MIINNNALISGLLGEHFRLEMMVPQRSKESLKASEGIIVSLLFTIIETQNIIEVRVRMDIRVELKNT